jgi:DNA modification methylase
MSVRIIVGDALEQLRLLPDEGVHCCVTSPPYYGLRDYGVAGQIGLEPSPDEYIAALVAVFREVRRVLRKDGTLWLNIGDSYAASWPRSRRSTIGAGSLPNGKREARASRLGGDLKTKDLIGIPWMLAFALRADGWWLRQDIIWSKPNPMPESVTDRCTKAHEYLFLLSKSERYWFDAGAIKEPAGYDPTDTKFPDGWDTGPGGHGAFHRNGRERGRKSGNKSHKYVTAYNASGTEEYRTKGGLMGIAETAYAVRNKRSVWTVASEPFHEAHFATFPSALIEPCVLAGCPAGGTALDPFGGAGATGLVADRLGRDAILIELNPAYAVMAKRRINDDAGPLLAAAQ